MDIYGAGKRRRSREERDEALRLDPEDVWEDEAVRRDMSPARRRAKVMWMSVLLVAAAAVVAIAVRQGEPGDQILAADAEGYVEGYVASPEAIAALAQAFADEADPQKRLALARVPEAVAAHLADYPEAALKGGVKSLRLLGAGRLLVPPRTAFVARMEGGGKRLLVVVEEDAGLRVDWDVFARYGTASWAALMAGEAGAADVRVFLRADNYYNEPFGDDSEWRAFQLTSPDVEQPMYAYAQVGSLREKYLMAVAATAPAAGSRMVLRIARRGGSDGRHLFEIERLLAAGWVLGSLELEEQLELGGEDAIERLNAEGPRSAPAATNPFIQTKFPELLPAKGG